MKTFQTKGEQAKRAGFTLTELLVAMAVVSVVMGLVFQLIIRTMEVSRDLQARIELQSQAARVLDSVADDLRSARKIAVVDSRDEDHPDVRITHNDGSETVYRWDGDSLDHLRLAKKRTDGGEQVSPDGLTTEGLHVSLQDGLAQVTLRASRTVRGTSRVVPLELSTQVQTLE